MGHRNSFWSQLGEDAFTAEHPFFHQVRDAMLSSMGRHDDQAHILLEMDIAASKDLSDIWHLRPRLLQVLTDCHGRAIAEDSLHKITDMFKKHIAAAMSSRFGSRV